MTCKLIQVLNGDLRINGALAPDEIDLPDGCLADRNVIPYTEIPAENCEHQHAVSYWQENGIDVVGESIVVHTFRAAGKIIAVSVLPIVPPTGAKTINVDVRRGNHGSDYASILSASVLIDASSAARMPRTGLLTVADTPVADGDTLEIVVTVAGSTGTQGQGLNVVIWIRENG